MSLKAGVLLRSKEDIIQAAILNQIETGGVDFFTSEDILIVAGIDDEDIKALKKETQISIDKFLKGRRAD